MSSHRETVEIVDKLIELTQHNQLIWESSEPPYNLTGPDVRIDLVYTTDYLDRCIRIYQKGYKLYIDDVQFFWDSRIIFEFIDLSGNSLWQFPQTSNVWDLLRSIQYQNSNISDFYKQIFGTSAM